MATLEERLDALITDLGTDYKAIIAAIGGLNDSSIASVVPEADKTANYVCVLADRARIIRVNSASDLLVTINAGIFGVGDSIQAYRKGTGNVTFAFGAGITVVNPHGSKVSVQGGLGSAVQVETDIWAVTGDVAT